MSSSASTMPAGADSGVPQRAGIILTTLIIVAAVANLPLAMANVALPSIGAYFQASQTQLNLVAVAYSLGLACSVLWLGALGDRYGRKQIAMLGVALAIPAALICGFAPSIQVLIAGRLFGGFAAGMAYPTTLALIAALWGAGAARTSAIALWAAIGGAINASGPLISGLLLVSFPWNSVFFVVLPVALVALFMAWRFLPSHVNETDEQVDNIGGILSVVLVGAFVLAINFAPVPAMRTLVLGLLLVTAVALVLFVLRQRRAENPLYDLKIAARPTFWVAAVGGIIVFGSLMGSLFIGQQFLQDVLGYSTVNAGLAILPAAAFMIVVAPRSAKMVEARGARFTLLAGYLFVLLGFVWMLLFWKEGISYWHVGIGYALVGVGVGLAGTPASRSLTASVPVTRVGMASGTADLQRDLGGALMQSIFGALLAAGYATAMTASIAATGQSSQVPATVTDELTMSFAGAQAMATAYPQYAEQITAAAKAAFLAGDTYAYLAGIIAVLIGAALVFFFYPRRDEERKVLAAYHAADMAGARPNSQG
ncbi:MAG: MFS transporter [Caldilinea sp.]|nr:MFS transporter [Caldilineaceae bacterium]MCO5213030.1 MFS transporter [Caldilinea sp.]